MIQLCVWMNIPSHYQSAFFAMLDERDDVDLQVVYLNQPSKSRADEGWNADHDLKCFESFASNGGSCLEIVADIPNWRERIHIISANFSDELVEFFCASKVRWCHWSEMPGVRLAQVLRYRMSLYRILNPLMLCLKKQEGARISRYALGALGQGILARKAFRQMGIAPEKIADLYYAPEALEQTDASEQVATFAAGRRVFLSVGALCKRKGIDILLRAFSKVKSKEWCLVLCGLDRADGAYRVLSKRLGIEDQVLFLGAYPSARINEVYRASDVFILASRFDGWGAVLNEAASLGLPLIGTELCGASWHLIEDGVTGHRVKTGSVRDLARAMACYARNPALVASHGDAAGVRFREEFTPARNAERLVRALMKWGCREG